jgi:hypothetical protein
MRFERAYSQGNPIKTQPVAAVLVKTVENRKKTGRTLCSAKCCKAIFAHIKKSWVSRITEHLVEIVQYPS